MQPFDTDVPVVLSLSSHDPTGGAGIQADIETAASLGCHCCSVVTALAARDTRDLKDIIAVDSTILIEQARAILEDFHVEAIKIGLLGGLANIRAVHSILMDYPDIPVVLDPVVKIGHLVPPNVEEFYEAIANLLLPLAAICTPSFSEAYELSKEADSVDACGHTMLESGCQYVLISGTPRQDGKLLNSLYGDHRLLKQFEWPHLTKICHGAGSTLASSIAAYMAHGLGIIDAVQQGQKFTWESIHAGRRLGMGKLLPNRFYWLNNSVEKQIVSTL